MEVGIELEVAYSGYGKLKEAVRIDFENIYTEHQDSVESEDIELNQGSLEIINSDEEPNIEAVEYVLDYMHENTGTSSEIARAVHREKKGLENKENIQHLVRDFKERGYVQRCELTTSLRSNRGRKQYSLLRDQDSVNNYTLEKWFKEGSKTNADIDFTVEQQSSPSWEKMLEDV